MGIRRVSLLAVAILGTMLHAPDTVAGSSGCGKTGAPGRTWVPLASMQIKTPLYVMQFSGKFFRVDLKRHVWTPISDHGFTEALDLVPSVDGRRMSYIGTRKDNPRIQYWIYDRQTGIDRLVHEHPAWGGGTPIFSPDGKFLAIGAGYDTRWGSDASAGVYLLDTASSRLVPVKLPISKQVWVSTRWSMDGAQLLIMVRSLDARDLFEYFSYRPSTKAVKKISGRYDSKAHEHIYTHLGRDIPLFGTVWARSLVGLSSKNSPDGKWRAFLESESTSNTYPLKVASRTGVAKEVALGRFDDCEGQTLLITGWVDEQHLVYRDRGLNYFVFETSTGKTASLFGDKESVKYFTW